MSSQEKGIRPSCALPYELYADGKLQDNKQHLEIKLKGGDTVFGKNAAGAPFTVYAPAKFTDSSANMAAQICRNWSFAVKAGDTLTYSWPLDAFEDGKYHLRVNGPNGYYREFKGTSNNPGLGVLCTYERNGANGKLTGNVLLKLVNANTKDYEVSVKDLGYRIMILKRK